jgi:signal transduction histidine kinase/ActR/RegA family two-component response regulator
MLEFFKELFDTSDFPARWHCGNWSQGLGWLHIVSDLMVFGAYFAIPVSLATYVRLKKQEVVFPKLYWLFAIFILSCGFTHLIEASIFWEPWYRFSGLMKAVTGAASWATVLMLWKAMPQAMALPGAAKLNVQLSREIEERKRSEAAMRESADQLSLAMAHAELGDWSWSARTNDCTLSARTAAILGVLPESRPTLALLRTQVHAEDRVLLPHETQSLPADAQNVSIDRELRFKRPNDGREVWIHVLGRVDLENGKPARARGIVQDVSGRKSSDADRERLLNSESKARSEAERANRMKDEFLATLSHELRTPLNAILNWAHILRTEPFSPDQNAMGLEIIERNSKTQVQLIEDLLDVGRIVSGKVRLDVQPVDLASVVNAAVDTVKPSALKKQIQLTSVLDPLAGPVRGDPARLQQVVWNLLANAVKFTPEGGRVNVSLERVNSHVEITVTDNGSGIDPEFLPFVFDRFLQADSSTTRRQGGLGLGLSIVKNLTELHGGTVSAKSPGVNQGATFRVQLPMPPLHQGGEGKGNRVHPGASTNGNDSDAVDLSGLRVFALDDETDALAALKHLFEMRGAEVMTACSGEQAIAALQAGRFDVVISDIGMPNMDGFEFIRRVRALQGPIRHVPAIALTAYARSDDRRRAMTAGFDTYLSKPVDAAELFAVVARQAARGKEAIS